MRQIDREWRAFEEQVALEMQSKNKRAPTQAERAHIERRPVVGYEGLYEVSADGLVFSVDRVLPHPVSGHRQLKGKLLSACKCNGGYVHVSLHKDGRGKSVNVHRIVCEAFYGLSSGKQVNHKNGVRDDNRACNLEWSTPSENNAHSFHTLGRRAPRNTLGKFGRLHHRSIAVEALDKTGSVVATYGSLHEAQRAGFAASSISAVLLGKRLSHGNLFWRKASAVQE